MIDGEEYPPYLYEGERKKFDKVTVVRDDQITDDQRRQLFAVGSDTGNLQVGFVMMNVLFLREHNRIARALEKEYGWDDERLFQTTRNILTVILIRIVVEEYINHISPYHLKLLADPTGFRNPRWYRHNWMAIEFNLLYRWHSLVPVELSHRRPRRRRERHALQHRHRRRARARRLLRGCLEPAGRARRPVQLSA